MLRASVEAKQQQVDLRAITDGARDGAVGIVHAAELLAFAEAAVRGDPSAIGRALSALRAKAGSAAVVDAAGVVGNFERMTRIADGTGIPLDAPVQLASEDFRGELGFSEFPSSRNTPSPPAWRRLLAPVLARGARLALRKLLARSGRAGHET